MINPGGLGGEGRNMEQEVGAYVKPLLPPWLGFDMGEHNISPESRGMQPAPSRKTFDEMICVSLFLC